MNEKPQVQVFLEELASYLRGQRSPQAAKLIPPLAGLIGAMNKKRITDSEVFVDWKPTPDNVRALPLPIRQHIESCEKLVKENEALREQLNLRINELLATRLNEPFDVVSHFSKLAEMLDVLV